MQGAVIYWGLFAGLLAAAVWLGLALAQSPPALCWVRVWGVPVAGKTVPVVLRLEGGALLPVEAWSSSTDLSVRLSDAAGRSQEQPVQLDEDQSAVVSFDAGLQAPLRLRVTRAAQLLAEGQLRGKANSISELITHHSGWIKGRHRGSLRVEAGSIDGRFVLGRPSQLVLRVTDASSMPRSVPVTVELEGLRNVAGVPLQGLATSALGTLSIAVLPVDLSAALKITATDSAGAKSEFFAEVPIEKLGIWGTREAEQLALHSLIPLRHLNYALLSEQGLWARGRVALDCSGAQACKASLPLPRNSFGERFIVLGREPSLDGDSAIGWSLDGASHEPRQTIHFRESLLLDGKALAMSAHERLLAKRAQRTLVGFVAVGLLFLLTVVTRFWRARAVVNLPLDDEGRAIELPLQSRRLVVVWMLFLVGSLIALGAWVTVRLVVR